MKLPIEHTAKTVISLGADLSVPWAHTSFCWFCHAVAHMFAVKVVLFKRLFIIPPANFVCGGVYCFHVVRPLVRPVRQSGHPSIGDTLVFS